MSQETEERLAEWAVWFHQNKKRIPPGNLAKQNLFLLKSVDGCLEVIAMLLKDVQLLEHRSPIGQLWLPKGMDVHGDITKFG
jgi:hypothetical protein